MQKPTSPLSSTIRPFSRPKCAQNILQTASFATQMRRSWWSNRWSNHRPSAPKKISSAVRPTRPASKRQTASQPIAPPENRARGPGSAIEPDRFQQAPNLSIGLHPTFKSHEMG